jgi:inhibitor of cysteine peptidase
MYHLIKSEVTWSVVHTSVPKGDLDMSKRFEACRNAITLLLAVLALAVSCGPFTEIKLDISDNGRQVEIERGQVLAITLESNASMGYTWEVIELDDSILQQAREPEFRMRGDRPGDPNDMTIRFEAVNSGRTTLKLLYHRRWEKEEAPQEIFSIEVVVR